MRLEDLNIYQLSNELAEKVWDIVNEWDSFNKETIGKQLVRAVDSVASNLSEGFGRYYYKEKRHYGYYSRGSLFETKTWLMKAHNRGLIGQEDYDVFMQDINVLGIKLNNFIRSIGNSNKVEEIEDEYDSFSNEN